MQKKLKILSIVLASISFSLFLAICILVLNKHVFKIDQFNMFIANNRTTFLNNFFKWFTFLGSFYALALICFICFLITFFKYKNKRLAIFTIVCFTFVSLLNFVLKRIIQRPRPENLMIIEEIGYSFPSGHSMMSLAMFGMLIYFCLKFIKNMPLKVCLTALLFVTITLIGFSRIYLGVHYLSDILAGWLVTFVVLVAFYLLYNFTLRGKEK